MDSTRRSIALLPRALAVSGLIILAVAALLLFGSSSSDRAAAGVLPTATPEATVGVQGDVDCDIDVDSVDALKDLRHVAALTVSQTEPCPDIGTKAPGLLTPWGDVDCDGDVDSVDALKDLRSVAALSVAQTEPCVDIGQPLVPLKGQGDLSGTVVNAVTGDPLADVAVNLRAGQTRIAASGLCAGASLDDTITNSEGAFSFHDVPAGFYNLDVNAGQDFIQSCRNNVLVLGDRNTIVSFGLSPVLPTGELRIVLTWGENPHDLDSHLWLPAADPYHICFADAGNATDFPFTFLDLDDTSSFGPETITIIEPQSGTYRYAVHNFSGEFGGDTPITQSGAHVDVFGEAGLIMSFDAPTSGSGLWWHVFDMNAQTGQVMPVNHLGDDPQPYEDDFGFCP